MPWVDVDLEDFDDDEIEAEYEARGLGLTNGQKSKDDLIVAIEKIHQLRRLGKDFSHQLDALIQDALGVCV